MIDAAQAKSSGKIILNQHLKSSNPSRDACPKYLPAIRAADLGDGAAPLPFGPIKYQSLENSRPRYFQTYLFQ